MVSSHCSVNAGHHNSQQGGCVGREREREGGEEGNMRAGRPHGRGPDRIQSVLA